MPCKYVDDCEGRPCYETEHECRCNCEHGGLDPSSKECRCKNFATCKPPRILEDDCSCACPDGQTWDGSSCVEDCPAGQRRNKATGKCEEINCWRPKPDNCGCEPAFGVSAADCLNFSYFANQALCEMKHPPCKPPDPPKAKCFRCDDPAKGACTEIDNPKPDTQCADQGLYDNRASCEAGCVPPKVNIQCWACEKDVCVEKTRNVNEGTTCNNIQDYDNEAACRQYGNCGSTPGGGGGGTNPPGGGGVACTPPFPPPMGKPLFCQDGTYHGLTTYRVDPATCQWVEISFVFGDCGSNGGTGGVAPPAGGGAGGGGCTPPTPPADKRETICGMSVPKLRGAVVECWASYTEYEWCTECSPEGLPLLKGVKVFSTGPQGGAFHPWATNNTAPDLACPPPSDGGGGGGSGGPGSDSGDLGSSSSGSGDRSPQLEARAVHVQPVPEGGAGTELKALLALVGITSTPTCKCNARAKEMDARGIAWCEENKPTVLAWLKEESERRKLPFFAAAGRMLIKRAIENAKRKGFK